MIFFPPQPHTPQHVGLCPHLLRNHTAGVRKRSVTVGGGRRRTGRASCDGDGVAGRLDPLWINWSCRLLRLVRLGWSQVC